MESYRSILLKKLIIEIGLIIILKPLLRYLGNKEKQKMAQLVMVEDPPTGVNKTGPAKNSIIGLGGMVVAR